MKTIAKTAFILASSVLLSGVAVAGDSCENSEVVVSNTSTHPISVKITPGKGAIVGADTQETIFELQPSTSRTVKVTTEDLGWKGWEASGEVLVKSIPGSDEYDKGKYEFDDHKMPYCTNGSKIETDDEKTVHMSLETGHVKGKDRATFEITDK